MTLLCPGVFESWSYNSLLARAPHMRDERMPAVSPRKFGHHTIAAPAQQWLSPKISKVMKQDADQ
eukprot:1780320-Prymnesium_polylepis.4